MSAATPAAIMTKETASVPLVIEKKFMGEENKRKIAKGKWEIAGYGKGAYWE